MSFLKRSMPCNAFIISVYWSLERNFNWNTVFSNIAVSNSIIINPSLSPLHIRNSISWDEWKRSEELVTKKEKGKMWEMWDTGGSFLHTSYYRADFFPRYILSHCGDQHRPCLTSCCSYPASVVHIVLYMSAILKHLHSAWVSQSSAWYCATLQSATFPVWFHSMYFRPTGTGYFSNQDFTCKCVVSLKNIFHCYMK